MRPPRRRRSAACTSPCRFLPRLARGGSALCHYDERRRRDRQADTNSSEIGVGCGPRSSAEMGSPMGGYDGVYGRSLDDPQGFWAEAARDIDWTRQPGRILDDSRPPFYRWFAGGELNTCTNALDRHVAA